MGICSCIQKGNDVAYFIDFWGKLSIRCKPSKDVVEVIRTKKDKNNQINEKKFMIIVDTLLSPEEDKGMANSIWKSAYDDSQQKGGCWLLFLSLFFLAEKNLFQAKKCFKELAECFNLNDHFKIENPGPGVSSVFIKRETLITVVEFYLNLISLSAVKEVSQWSSNKTEFESYFNRVFMDRVQKHFIEEVVFSGFKDEWVDYDKFFDVHYKLLSDDIKIRENLMQIYETGKIVV